MPAAMNRVFEPLTRREVASLFADAPFPWWICGGWAIDGFLGHETRAHADIEVGVLRRDQCALYERLADFEVHLARSGTLTELSAAERRRGVHDPDHHGFWCRKRGEETWLLEILLEDSDGGDWVFRRDARIRRPIAEIFHREGEGLPYFAPEIQLLFKAKATRERDEHDFRATLPELTRSQRDWLAEALGLVHPGHAWLAYLA